MRKALRALCFCLLLLAAATPGTRAGAETRVLRVGTFLDNAPWQYRDGDRIVGFEADMVERIGHELGARIEWVVMPFADLFEAVERGRVDLVACSITITPERRKRFDFTQAYYDSAQGVVVLKAGPIRRIEDLGARPVAVTPGTSNEAWLRENGPRLGLGPLVPAQGVSAVLDLLTAGKVSAYFGDLPTLLHELLHRSDLAVIERIDTGDHYAMMFAKGAPLTVPVDDAITQMKQDGTMARIHTRWFGMAPDRHSSTVQVRSRG
ncbi:ABC transporter substrate-binding protein [Ancylobacter sp. 6x-1]|uniref:ABC transporter substrate-binding protein n=1 Tax=Ancylobacter crimeensis TaxID=2579147 RepID=A0ABT0DE50_9HYPH|nr:ABC transporter substrate-binding protein [Ancylobacter crimeensis]MCK0198252.1 ABC transporter substrate-binding protein [Ancylobacter crimeensis]